jgi:hypothetical protein
VFDLHQGYRYSSSEKRSHNLLVNSVLYSVGTVEGGRVKLKTCLHLIPRLNISAAMISVPHTSIKPGA